MAKKVENKDLFADDLFKSTVKDVELLITELDKLEKSIVEVAKAQKTILGNSDTKSIEGIRATNESIKKLSETEKMHLKLQQDKLTLENKLKAARTNQAQQNAELNVLVQQQNRINKQAVLENEKLNGSYSAQSARLNRLRKEYKDLATSKGATSVKAKELLKEITRLDTKLKDVDKTVGQSQRNVGNYGSAFSRLGGILKGGLGALGITAGIAGLVRGIGAAVGIFKDFEAANSKLKSVLGATESEMKLLSDQAKELGASTAFTASQVTDLQTEFAKLGFPTKEILNMTESTLNAAAAMGSQLGEQAALTGATIKAFGLSSKDAARVNDVLAKSTARSALDFSKLNASMSTIAPVANAMGFGLEDTVALLGNLSDSGFDASTASTATRNIMLKLADSSSVLGKRLKEPVKDLPSLIRGLKQLTSEGVDLSQALELTDVRSVAAFATFMKGTDSLERLSAELNNASGAAKEMAETMLDNLSGDITKAQSAWEGFILGIEDGRGKLSLLFRDIVQVVTELLALANGTAKAEKDLTKAEKRIRSIAESIITFAKFLKIATVSYVAYLVVSKTIAGVEKIITLGRQAMLLVTKAQTTATNINTAATKAAETAQKSFNAATKANVIGLVVAALFAAYEAYKAFSQSVDEATRLQNAFNDATQTGSEVAAKRIYEENALLDEKIAKINREIELKKSLITNEKELAKLDKQKAADTQKAIADEANIIKNQISYAQRRRLELVKEDEARDISFKKRLDEANKADLLDASTSKNGLNRGLNKRKVEKEIQDEKIRLTKETATIIAYQTEKEKQLVDLQNRLTDATIDNNNIKKEDIKLTKEQLDAIKKRNEELDKYRKMLEDLNNELIEDELNKKLAKIQTSFKREIEAIKGNSEVEIELRKKLEIKKNKDVDEAVDKYRAKRKEIEKPKEKELKLRTDFKGIDDDYLEKQQEKLIEQEELRKELTEATLEVISTMLEEYHKRELEAIDKQIAATEKRVDQLRKKAELGQLASEESLAFEEKKQAELEQKRLQAQKRQQREQALFTVISTYQSKIAAGDKSPLLSTIKDIAVLKSFASTLAGFYEGTDDVGKSLGKPQLSGKDGHIVRVDGKEQIWSAKDRAAVGFRSRDEIKDLVGLVDNGLINNITNRDIFNPNSFVLNGLMDKKVLSKLDGIEKAIAKIDIPEGMVDIDQVRGLINLYSQKSNKKTIERSKLFN